MPISMPCTVIIPAYNEAPVIGRCLATLLADAPSPDAVEIIVVANGCVDDTVAIARDVAPSARIVELPEGSKTAAINAADAIASHFPRIYLDADVECSFATVQALASVLEQPGSMTAAPAIRLALDRSDWFVRSYYRIWLKQPFATSGNGGAGCYALSQAAHETIGRFPEIIGDDIWIHTRFDPATKRYVDKNRDGDPVFTIVHPPRTAIEQIRVEARRQIGNAEVLREHPSPHETRSQGAGALAVAIRRGGNPIEILVFFGMKIAARLLARWNRSRGRGAVWSRDLTSRQVQR